MHCQYSRMIANLTCLLWAPCCATKVTLFCMHINNYDGQIDSNTYLNVITVKNDSNLWPSLYNSSARSQYLCSKRILLKKVMLVVKLIHTKVILVNWYLLAPNFWHLSASGPKRRKVTTSISNCQLMANYYIRGVNYSFTELFKNL